MNAQAILDDMNLVIEILVRLPPKSVFRFISVSKTWEKTISTDPLFLRSYSRRRSSTRGSRLLAILANKKKQSPGWELPPPPSIHFSDDITIELGSRKLWCIYNSSNGLFLTGQFLTGSSLYVVNVITQKWTTLPPSPNTFKGSSNGIMCEDNFSELKAKYIVVRARKPLDNDMMQIVTYSSSTGEWTESTLVATGNFNLSLGSPIVANGVFHWNTLDRTTIVVYDPKDRVKNHLQLIEKPKCRLEDHNIKLTRSTADNVLWLCMMDMEDWKLYMLPKDGDCAPSYRRKTTILHDEWVLMHCISRYSLIMNDYHLSFVETGLIISWNPNPFTIVIGEGEVIFPYTLETKSLKLDPYRQNLIPYLGIDFLSAYALPHMMLDDY